MSRVAQFLVAATAVVGLATAATVATVAVAAWRLYSPLLRSVIVFDRDGAVLHRMRGMREVEAAAELVGRLADVVVVAVPKGCDDRDALQVARERFSSRSLIDLRAAAVASGAIDGARRVLVVRIEERSLEWTVLDGEDDAAIDDVVIIGGSCIVPTIKPMFEETFVGKPRSSGRDKDAARGFVMLLMWSILMDALR